MSVDTKAYIRGKKNDEIISYLKNIDKNLIMSKGIFTLKKHEYYFIRFKFNGRDRSMYLSSSEATNNEFLKENIVSFIPDEEKYTLISLGADKDAKTLIRDMCKSLGGGYYIPEDTDDKYEVINAIRK